MESTDNENVKSKRDALIERLRAKRPQSSYDDDEAVYADIMTEMTEMDGNLKGYKENEEMLLSAFDKNPKIAALFMQMQKGENPLLFLIENFGDDFREALDNPQIKDKIVEANSKYLQRNTKEKELQKQSQKNLSTSIEALNQAQAELQCSDQDTTNAFETFAQIVEDAIVDKVTKDTWIMIIKALNHDIDVQEAAHQAEVRGRNSKIDTLKAKQSTPANLPPQIVGQGAKATPKLQNIEGALARYGADKKGIWDK